MFVLAYCSLFQDVCCHTHRRRLGFHLTQVMWRILHIIFYAYIIYGEMIVLAYCSLLQDVCCQMHRRRIGFHLTQVMWRLYVILYAQCIAHIIYSEMIVLAYCSLFRCASISSTYPSMSVRPSVGHTFGFPIGQRLWSPYVKS